MPSRFVFRLDRLLRLRELTEDARLRQLAEARARTGRSENARDGLMAAEGEAESALASICGEGPLDLDALKSSWGELERTRAGLLKAGEDLARKRHEESSARTAYAAAGRDRTVLSHLRQRKELEHLREYDRWEQKLLDEAGARRRS